MHMLPWGHMLPGDPDLGIPSVESNVVRYQCQTKDQTNLCEVYLLIHTLTSKLRG